MKRIVVELLFAITLAISLCGCNSKASGENYFGGKGELRFTDGVLQDDNNFYFGNDILYKFNTETQTASVACQMPGCTHTLPDCKANLSDNQYTVFNGRLIKRVDEKTYGADGTVSEVGYLYLCDDNKQVFKNVYPESFTDEQKETTNCDIGRMTPLGKEHLALVCSGFIHILDADLNIKYTFSDIGPYSGGIYFFDNEIYYINNLFCLIKIDKETGKTTTVDLDSMKITEGELNGDTLWFSNEDKTLCSYDFKTGEVKEHVKSAVQLTVIGNYIRYFDSSNSEGVKSFRIYNIETGEDKTWKLTQNNYSFFKTGNNYFSYIYRPEKQLVQYSPDLSEVIKVYSLSV